MPFQILPLLADKFADLPSLTESELRVRNIDLQVVKEFPGTPCRVTLDDAEVGETVYLLNWMHLDEQSPYRASHAIFVRADATTANPAIDELPPALLRRPISVRGYDQAHRMQSADLADGPALADAIEDMFADETISYIHLHNAKPGCFAAKVVRA